MASPPRGGHGGGHHSAKVAPAAGDDDDDGVYVLPKEDLSGVLWLFLAPFIAGNLGKQYVNKIGATMIAFEHDSKMQMRCSLDLSRILRYDRWLRLAAAAHIPERVMHALDLHEDDEILVREALECMRKMIRTESIAEIVRKANGRVLFAKIRDANREDEFIAGDTSACLKALHNLGTSFARGAIETAYDSAKERGSLQSAASILVTMEEHSEKNAVQAYAVETLVALLALPNGGDHMEPVRDGIPRFEAIFAEHKRDGKLMMKLMLLLDTVARSGDGARADIGRTQCIVFAVDALMAYPKDASVTQSALWLVDQLTSTPDNFRRFLGCGGDIKMTQLLEHIETSQLRVIIPLKISRRLAVQ